MAGNRLPAGRGPGCPAGVGRRCYYSGRQARRSLYFGGNRHQPGGSVRRGGIHCSMRTVRAFPLALLLPLGACGGGDSLSSLAATGKTLYAEKGCASCHSVDGSTKIGPTWKGLYQSEVELSDGSKVVADDAYLKESMLQPSAKTVANFPPGLMETVIKPNSLSGAEVDALVAYIKSLQ